MISASMQKALNEQINHEMYSAYLYLAMSSYASSIDLDGFANWFRVQYQEEMFHAFKIYDYVIEQDGQVTLAAIDQPPAEFGTPLETMEQVLEHEKKVTGLIHKLADQAVQEKDHATGIFLQWFVTEQVEEEASAKKIIQQLKRIGDNPGALFMIDGHLAARSFNPGAD